MAGNAGSWKVFQPLAGHLNDGHNSDIGLSGGQLISISEPRRVPVLVTSNTAGPDGTSGKAGVKRWLLYAMGTRVGVTARTLVTGSANPACV
jgi:hypothetical protein